MIVKRNKRENFADDFDREIIFVQNIEIFDVASDVSVDKTSDFIEMTNDEKNGEVVNSIVVKDEKSEKSNSENFDFFACFVRTCS